MLADTLAETADSATRFLAVFDITTGLAIAGFAFGLIGTTLSIFNFLMNLHDRRISLRITPKISYNFGRGFMSTSIYRPDDMDSFILEAVSRSGQLPIPAIEVVNLSKFTVTIDEVGFCPETPLKGGRHVFLQPGTIPEMKPPYRLEPRSSVTFYAHKADPALWMNRNATKYAYVVTGCGSLKRKRSRDFTKMQEHIRTQLEQSTKQTNDSNVRSSRIS